MRILVLGAGAIGGYFGGRLAEGGADVTFLVRGRRKAELDASGLVVKSIAGNIALKVKTIAAGAKAPPFDIVLLSCKSFDLDPAIAAIAPFMGPRSGVVPVLNGLAHIDRLIEALGPGRVMGGACHIGAVLEPDGAVRHVGDLQSITFGELDGEASDRAKALLAEFARTKVKAILAPDILQAMWEKLVMLAALAATTTLTRATVGEIMAAPSGERFALAALGECASVAAAEGHESDRRRARSGAGAADRQGLALRRFGDARSGGRPPHRGRPYRRRPGPPRQAPRPAGPHPHHRAHQPRGARGAAGQRVKVHRQNSAASHPTQAGHCEERIDAHPSSSQAGLAPPARDCFASFAMTGRFTAWSSLRRQNGAQRRVLLPIAVAASARA